MGEAKELAAIFQLPCVHPAALDPDETVLVLTSTSPRFISPVGY
jgi:hypothetical protein